MRSYLSPSYSDTLLQRETLRQGGCISEEIHPWLSAQVYSLHSTLHTHPHYSVVTIRLSIYFVRLLL